MKKKGKNNNNQPLSPKKYIREKARTLPLGKCYINSTWKEEGIATIIVSRVRPSGNVVVGSYLTDILCLGVKDTMWFPNMTPSEFKDLLNRYDESIGLEETDYALAHNIIYGAIEFAEDAEILPCKDFELTEYILEEDDERVPLIDIEFGLNGKHHLVVGLTGNDRLYISKLQRTLGENFTYDDMFSLDESSDFDEVEDDYNISPELDEELRKYVDSLTPEERERALKMAVKIMEGRERTDSENKRHKTLRYSYEHPEYPMKLNLHFEILSKFLLHKPGNFLTNEQITTILKLPQDELMDDLISIVRYAIGKTFEKKNQIQKNNYLSWSLINTLGLFMELKDSRALPAIFELLHQNYTFDTFIFGDRAVDILGGALIACGRNNLDQMEQFLMEKGPENDMKFVVMESLENLVLADPSYREQVLEIFERVLKYMFDKVKDADGFDSETAGFLISSLTELQDKSALPLIKQFFDADLVNLNFLSGYHEVEKDVNDPDFEPLNHGLPTTIQELYSHLKCNCF